MTILQAIIEAPADLLDELRARDDVTVRLCHQDEHSGFEDHDERIPQLLFAYAEYTNRPQPNRQTVSQLTISQQAAMIECVVQFSEWLEDGQLNDETVHQLAAIRPPIL